MNKVEQLAREEFLTFRNRLCEMLSEIEEEIKSSFEHGYTEGKSDEKFRVKPPIESRLVQLTTENPELKVTIERMENQIESMKNTLKEIARDTNEHTTHNVAQNELDKWEEDE